MLARLLATENIRVEHNASAETAYFDIKNRMLVLPVWESMSEAIYDMLVGHEVSHALHTPMDEWEDATKDMFVCQRRNFQQVCNIVEDARIERLIKSRFPGLKRDFAKAYAELHNRDMFEIANRDLSEMNLIDRLNLEFKLGLFGLVEVPFGADEKQYVKRMAETKTFADVIELSKDLFNSWKDQQEQLQNEQGQSQDQDEQEDGEGNDENAINGDSGDGEESQQDGEESQQDGEESQQDAEEQCDCPECVADRASQDGEESQQDGEESQDGEEKGSGEEGEGKGSEPTDYTYDDYTAGSEVGGKVSETQTAMDKAISNMQDKDCRSTNYYSVPKSMNLESSVVDFTQVRKIWDDFITRRNARNEANGISRRYEAEQTEECNQFLVRSKSVVNHMVQQFQMKQSADADRRTSIAKTGVLDTTNMIDYRWSEDIFRKNETIADGKSHGMIMYLDWSGSMNGMLKDTVEQLLILTEFCQKVNIPFEVYAFTSQQIQGEYRDENDRISYKELEFSTDADNTCRQLSAHSYSLINFLSSRMNNRQYKVAVRELYECAAQRYGNIPKVFGTGCTPLNEAIMCALQQVPAFQEQTGVQIVNTVFLTDGDGHSMGARGYSYRRNEKIYVHDPVTRKDYDMDGNDYRAETNVYLDILKDRTQCNIIGIRLHCAKNISNLRYSYIEETELGKATADYRKNNFCVASANKTSYDEFFIVKGNLNATADIFAAIDDDASFAKIKNAFKKNAQSTKTSRVIATKMIEIFAGSK